MKKDSLVAFLLGQCKYGVKAEGMIRNIVDYAEKMPTEDEQLEFLYSMLSGENTVSNARLSKATLIPYVKSTKLITIEKTVTTRQIGTMEVPEDADEKEIQEILRICQEGEAQVPIQFSEEVSDPATFRLASEVSVSDAEIDETGSTHVFVFRGGEIQSVPFCTLKYRDIIVLKDSRLYEVYCAPSKYDTGTKKRIDQRTTCRGKWHVPVHRIPFTKTDKCTLAESALVATREEVSRMPKIPKDPLNFQIMVDNLLCGCAMLGME